MAAEKPVLASLFLLLLSCFGIRLLQPGQPHPSCSLAAAEHCNSTADDGPPVLARSVFACVSSYYNVERLAHLKLVRASRLHHDLKCCLCRLPGWASVSFKSWNMHDHLSMQDVGSFQHWLC